MGCRTPVHGFTVYKCEKCGRTHFIHRGCGDRHCSTCQASKALTWMDAPLEKMLPADYFLTTFTVPGEIRDFMRSHQHESYKASFWCMECTLL